MHEAALHEDNAFVTLTYAPENLPAGATLVKRHFQLFMKRLRKFFGQERIRFFHCGEYGDELLRPHYHALLFGVHFPDQVEHKRSHDGSILWRSPTLDRLWGLGRCLVGAVSFESAAYVARYCVSKITGPAAEQHYLRLDEDTGELVPVLPEYVTMSTKPGIGAPWFARFGRELELGDSVVARGRQMKPPRYYDKLRAARDSRFNLVKAARIKASKTRKARANNTPERLAVREAVKTAQISLYKRGVSDG